MNNITNKNNSKYIDCVSSTAAGFANFLLLLLISRILFSIDLVLAKERIYY